MPRGRKTAKREAPKRLSPGHVLSKVLLTPIILKSIVVTLLTALIIYFIGFFKLATFFVAFVGVFIALIIVEEVQEGTRGVEHSATELGILAAIIALVLMFGQIDLNTFQLLPILQTLVVTFVAIILYLLIVHPTKMERAYMQRVEKRYLTR